jgi:hypothetical protein
MNQATPQGLPMPLPQARLIALGSRNGKLGEPSKMPGYSFGLSAFLCKRGEKLTADPRNVCAHCYARTNYYRTWEPVLIAHERREAGLRHRLWVAAMVTLVLHHTDPDDPYFRWHDSGDIRSVGHLRKIVEVCLRTPQVRHWLPTHEPFLVKTYLELVAVGGAPPFPPNLCVRISADRINAPPDRIEGLEGLPTATSHTGHGNARIVQVSDHRRDSIECKAYTRTPRADAAGTCGNCRVCWDPRVRNISYPLHGAKKQLRLPVIS